MLREILEKRINEDVILKEDKELLGKIVKYNDEYYTIIEANRTPNDLLFAIKSLDGKKIKAFLNPDFKEIEVIGNKEEVVRSIAEEFEDTINLYASNDFARKCKFNLEDKKMLKSFYQEKGCYYKSTDDFINCVNKLVKKGSIIGTANTDGLNAIENLQKKFNKLFKNLGIKVNIVECDNRFIVNIIS